MIDRKLINELYRNGHKKAEIARLLGVSRQRIHQILIGYKSNPAHRCTICRIGKPEKEYPFNGKSCSICLKCFYELKRTRPHSWSLKYSSCIECGTTETPHVANGLCRNCYRRIYYFKQKRFLV